MLNYNLIKFVLYKMVQIDLNLYTITIHHTIIKLEKHAWSWKINWYGKKCYYIFALKIKTVNESRILSGREILLPQVSEIIK